MENLAEKPKPTLFFTRTFDEARILLHEARDYLGYVADDDLDGAPPTERLVFVLESSRLTARLVNIMSWLLMQRAVHSGEMDEAEAVAEGPNLQARAKVLGQSPTGGVPPMMAELLDRSQKLYVRVARLDEMVRQKTL